MPNKLNKWDSNRKSEYFKMHIVKKQLKHEKKINANKVKKKIYINYAQTTTV